MIMAWALASGLGCGGEFEPEGDDDEGTTAESASDATSGGARDVEGGGAGGAPTDDQPTTSVGGGDSSGGVEEGGGEPTTFGMSDDMPLVADIPDIKRGLWGEGSWLSIEQVRPSSGMATLGREQWFYVQDPFATEDMGLRVHVLPGDAFPAQDRWVDLVGFVVIGTQGGPELQLESVAEGGLHPGVRPRRVRIANLTASNAGIFDDSVVELSEPGGLVVKRRGADMGTVLVGPTSVSGGLILVDLRPFGLDEIEPAPGTPLLRLGGVAELDGPRPVILPRTSEDLIAAG